MHITSMRTHTYTHLHVLMHTQHTHAQRHMHTYTHTHIHMHTQRTHAQTHRHTYTHTHTNTHACAAAYGGGMMPQGQQGMPYPAPAMQHDGMYPPTSAAAMGGYPPHLHQGDCHCFCGGWVGAGTDVR